VTNTTTRGPDRRWRNRAIERRPADRGALRACRVVLALLLAAAPIGLYMWRQNESLKLSYAVQELRAEHERLLELERRSRVERAAAESLDDIERWAVERQGLERPDAEQITVLRGSRPEPAVLLARGSPRN
jgi:hypothetical protein